MNYAMMVPKNAGYKIVRSLKTIVACAVVSFSLMMNGASTWVPVSNFNVTDSHNAVYKKGSDYFGKTFFSFRPQDSDSSRRILGWFNADYRNDDFDPETQVVFGADSDGKKHHVVKGLSRKVVDWFNEDAVDGYHDEDYQEEDSSWEPCYVLNLSAQYTRSFHTEGIAQWFFFNGCDTMTVGIPNEYESFNIDGSQIGLSLGTLFDPYTDSVFLASGLIGSVTAKPIVENYIVDIDLWYDLSAWHENLWSRIEAPIVYMKTNMQMCSSGRGNQTDEYPLGLFSLDKTIVDTYYDEICGAAPVPYSSIVCALEGNQGWGAVEPLRAGKFPSHELNKWTVPGVHFDLGYDIYDKLPWYFAGSMHIVFPTGNRPKGIYVFEPIIGANKSWQLGATAIAHYIKQFDQSEFGIYFYAVGTHLFKSKQDRVFSLNCNGPGSQLLLLKQFNDDKTGLINAEREANIFLGTTKIGATLMFDGSLMFQYSHKHLVLDLGYNLWARTPEHRSKSVGLKMCCDTAFGIKGDAPMEFQTMIGCLSSPVQCLNDTETQSCARICGPAAQDDAVTTFITPGDLNYQAALHPAAMSHKVFAATGYKSWWYALISGEAEFSTNNAALNQWGVMLKVGIYF